MSEKNLRRGNMEGNLGRTSFSLNPLNIAWLKAKAVKNNTNSSAYLDKILDAYRLREQK